MIGRRSGWCDPGLESSRLTRRNLAGVGQMNAVLFSLPDSSVYVHKSMISDAHNYGFRDVGSESGRLLSDRTLPDARNLAGVVNALGCQRLLRESGMLLAARGLCRSRECSWLPEASVGVGPCLNWNN